MGYAVHREHFGMSRSQLKKVSSTLLLSIAFSAIHCIGSRFACSTSSLICISFSPLLPSLMPHPPPPLHLSACIFFQSSSGFVRQQHELGVPREGRSPFSLPPFGQTDKLFASAGNRIRCLRGKRIWLASGLGGDAACCGGSRDKFLKRSPARRV